MFAMHHSDKKLSTNFFREFSEFSEFSEFNAFDIVRKLYPKFLILSKLSLIIGTTYPHFLPSVASDPF